MAKGQHRDDGTTAKHLAKTVKPAGRHTKPAQANLKKNK